MPVSIIGYNRSGYGYERIEICKKVKSKTISDSFKTLAGIYGDYVTSKGLEKEHGLKWSISRDNNAKTDIYHIIVPEDFPYFIVQDRSIINHIDHRGKELYTDFKTILFEPGEFEPESGIKIKYPTLKFNYINNTKYKSILERDYRELEKLCQMWR